MVRRSKRNRDVSADDGNAMGLTEAFHPVSADGFTTAMPPMGEGDGSIIEEDVVVDEEGVFEEVDLGDGEALDDEGLPAGESFPDEAVFEDFYAAGCRRRRCRGRIARARRRAPRRGDGRCGANQACE